MSIFILPSGLRKRSSNVGGSLKCPWCDSNKIKKIDSFPPDRDVYRCYNKIINRITLKPVVCGKKFTYVTTPMAVDDPQRMKRPEEQPYAHINRGNNAWLSQLPFGKKIPVSLFGKKYKMSKHKV